MERAKEIIAGLDTQKESVVVEEMAVGGNSKVRLCPLTLHSSYHVVTSSAMVIYDGVRGN